MENYKSNSYRSKNNNETSTTEKKKVEKIVKGTVKPKKKNEIRKLADIFISDDVANVKSYILMGVLVPSIKSAISDIVKNGIDMILYNGSPPTSKKTSNSQRVSYRSYYDKDNKNSKYEERNDYPEYDELIFDDRAEAEDVLYMMKELIEVYGTVSIADLYDLVGITSKNYTDNNYGWFDLHRADIRSINGGWLLKLPRTSPLKNLVR